MPDSIEIPTPIIRVVTTESWRSAGWTGFREFTCTISVGDVVLMERATNDDVDYMATEERLREKTVNEFGERLKALLESVEPS
jgi:hypothetical protein